MTSFVVAIAENGVIGNDNKLLWHLPADLKFFKQTTMGHPIIMGRKTFDSIGRVLPGRRNIVITRNKDFKKEGVDVFHSVEELMKNVNTNEELMVIGGAEIYRLFFLTCDRLYITWVHHKFEGDTFFPEFNLEEWKEISSEKHLKDEKNAFDYTFAIYDKKNT
jgi:dihydrofolate reductase